MMQLKKLILKELFIRKHRLLTAVLAITLGMAGVVGINTVTRASVELLRKELDTLGFNLLILPLATTVEDYYSADTKGSLLPEEYARRLAHSGLHGMNLLSPKLSGRVALRGQEITLTGILPVEELNKQQAANPFLETRYIDNPPVKQTVKTPERLINSLGPHEARIGNDAAARLRLIRGQRITIRGIVLTVSRILPTTGTVDDSRVFTHLHTAQRILNKPNLLSVIEVVGCCDQIRSGLVPHINRLIPGSKVVTIRQIVSTQEKTNRLMAELSRVLLLVILLISGAGIANTISANAHERRREIGILMAIGASKGLIRRLFLGKALLIGLLGGIGGYLLGTLAALLYHTGTAFLPDQLILSLTSATCVTLLAALIPAVRAASLDPAIVFREV